MIAMDSADYKKMAEEIRGELESLEIQQEDIERRIARLRQALIGLVPLSKEPIHAGMYGIDLTSVAAEIDSMSITDATRQILQAAEAPLAPTEIKKRLIDMGKDLSNQKNVMASVHSLLKRLVQGGEIETRDNGLTYQWIARRIRAHFPSHRRRLIDKVTQKEPSR
jgi:hypothetical protein